MSCTTRPSHFALAFLICTSGVFLLTFAQASYLRSERSKAFEQRREMVIELQLTDLCLFTEARYTRHPSQADLHSAFQDHPSGLEHFPAGSLVSPPSHLIATHDRLDRKTQVPD